jgi:hypothetical protein
MWRRHDDRMLMKTVSSFLASLLSCVCPRLVLQVDLLVTVEGEAGGIWLAPRTLE